MGLSTFFRTYLRYMRDIFINKCQSFSIEFCPSNNIMAILWQYFIMTILYYIPSNICKYYYDYFDLYLLLIVSEITTSCSMLTQRIFLFWIGAFDPGAFATHVYLLSLTFTFKVRKDILIYTIYFGFNSLIFICLERQRHCY